MALNQEDDYIRAINDTVFDRAGDYYRTSTPFQVGADVRSTASDVSSGVRGAINRGNANAARYDATMDAAFDNGPLMRASRGVGDFWRGLTGSSETTAPTAAPRTNTSALAPSARETPAQFVDRVRATGAPESTNARAGTIVTRDPSGGNTVRDPGPNGTLSVIGSQDDSWKRYLTSNSPDAVPAVQSIGVEQRPSALAEYMNSSRYREQSGRGRAGRNQIQLDIKGLEDVDNEAGRNTRSGAELALRAQELNQRGALETGRWARDAESQNQRIGAEFARDDRRYQADERMADKRGALERDNLDYRYQLESPERDARIGRLNLESQQLGIENADKQSALDLRSRATQGDPKAIALIQALSGSKGPNGPSQEMLDAFTQVSALRAAGKDAEARQLYDMMVKPYIKQGYAQGGQVAGAITPQIPQINPLEGMYRQYAMNTQAVGAIPVEFGQFVDLMQGAQGNPGNMGMGYANGGFVDTMAKGFRRTWRNLTGDDEQPAQQPAIQPVQPQQQPMQGETQQDAARRTFGGSLRAIDEMDRRGYAQGGAIDVSGHRLVGPGTGTSDSIPAVVDGQTPAALSHGEFVWTNSATENAGAGNLKHIMQGLERGDPTIVAGVIGLAAKAAGSNAKAIDTRGN
jgi:hypothetical protein